MDHRFFQLLLDTIWYSSAAARPSSNGVEAGTLVVVRRQHAPIFIAMIFIREAGSNDPMVGFNAIDPFPRNAHEPAPFPSNFYSLKDR